VVFPTGVHESGLPDSDSIMPDVLELETWFKNKILAVMK